MTIDIPNLLSRFRRKPADFALETDAYRQVFGSPAAMNIVLPDIAEFCGAYTPLPQGIEQQSRAAGRRDVWLHIFGYLNISDRQVYAVMHGEPITRLQEKPLA